MLGWLICWVCIGGGAFMVMSYGLSFGNDKTYQWIVSMISAFFSSILLTQPLKAGSSSFGWRGGGGGREGSVEEEEGGEGGGEMISNRASATATTTMKKTQSATAFPMFLCVTCQIACLALCIGYCLKKPKFDDDHAESDEPPPHLYYDEELWKSECDFFFFNWILWLGKLCGT